MKYDTKKTESHAVKFLAKIFWSGQKWLSVFQQKLIISTAARSSY